MKSYVILDTKFSDLKTTKQKVIQEITRAAASDKEKDVPTLDEINEVSLGSDLLNSVWKKYFVISLMGFSFSGTEENLIKGIRKACGWLLGKGCPLRQHERLCCWWTGRTGGGDGRWRWLGCYRPIHSNDWPVFEEGIRQPCQKCELQSSVRKRHHHGTDKSLGVSWPPRTPLLPYGVQCSCQSSGFGSRRRPQASLGANPGSSYVIFKIWFSEPCAIVCANLSRFPCRSCLSHFVNTDCTCRNTWRTHRSIF